MSRETPTENLTGYLLGEMPEQERARLEDAFLGDEKLFQRLSEAEHDLLDDYVGGRLAAPARELFERHYLQLPGSRERLHTARLIARERSAAVTQAPPRAVVEPERPGLLESLRAFWRGAFPSVTPYALGLAALAVVVGGVWWAVTRNGRGGDGRAPELAKAIPDATPLPTSQGTPTVTVPTPDANMNASTPAPTTTLTPRGPGPRPVQTPAPAQPRSEARTVTVLALVAGLTRGDGGANRLVVPKGGGAVRLEFGLAADKYRDVRATLRTVEGREVWAGRVTPRAGGRAALSLPARIFADEDYLLILSGTDAAGARAEFQEFYFNAEVR